MTVAPLLAMLLLIAGGMFASAAFAAPTRQMGSASDQLKPLSGKDFEVQFMSMMIVHHQGAIDMAKLVPDRANHAELKTVAQNIISSQTSEIKEMTDWRQSWYNMAPMDTSNMNMGDMGMGMGDMTKLAALKGDDFDKEFMIEMRTHHMSAIEMAQLVPDRATHAELKTLAQNIISAQNMEIQEFDTWLKSWYNVDASGMAMPTAMTGGMAMPTATAMAGGMAMPTAMAGGTAMPQTGAGDSSGSLLLILGVAGALLLLGAFFIGVTRRQQRI